MAKSDQVSEKDLRGVLQELGDQFSNLLDHQLFVLWFARAMLTSTEEEAAGTLTGVARDKGIDAIYIDDGTKGVFLIQGKYRKGIGKRTEKRDEVMAFAHIASILVGSHANYVTYCKNLAPNVHEQFSKARERVLKRNYRLQLNYVTTGRCSAPLREEAERVVESVNNRTIFRLVDGRETLRTLSDYLDGVAPPVPSLTLSMEQGDGIQTRGILNRLDNKTGIESWVFSMNGKNVADLFEQAGVRLFARNVRGFLGNTEINHGMEDTLQNESAFFWYYNNGITIVCDQAQEVKSGQKHSLRVANAQVINGQQTTRVLARPSTGGARSSVLVRVISVPRGAETQNFNRLVSKIVAATNWQNAIRPSDLMANDSRQIELERQLHKLGYYYIRKRQTKGEVRRSIGQHVTLVKKDEVAQAVAGCELDPAIVRGGKEKLFEERWYPEIFGHSDPYYYLTRLCLLQEVSHAARGYPERAYAKWVVLGFTWSRIGSLLRKKETAAQFVQLRSSPAELALENLIGGVFKASLRFYRANRGKGARAIDPSAFFQKHGLDKEFEKFWASPANSARASFKKQLARFETLLGDAA